MVWVTATGSHTPRGDVFLSNSDLYWWDEVPQVLQFNPYVKSGYRAGKLRADSRDVMHGESLLLLLCSTANARCCTDMQILAGLSCQQCLGSLFHYHNETGNSSPYNLLLNCCSPGAMLCSDFTTYCLADSPEAHIRVCLYSLLLHQIMPLIVLLQWSGRHQSQLAGSCLTSTIVSLVYTIFGCAHRQYLGAPDPAASMCCHSPSRHGGTLASGWDCSAFSSSPSHAMPCWFSHIPYYDGQSLELQALHHN